MALGQQLGKLRVFALTEPLHGSHSVAPETCARRDGDEWVHLFLLERSAETAALIARFLQQG